MDGVEGQADPRAFDAIENEKGDCHHDEAKIVVIYRLVEIDREDVGHWRNALDALRATEQEGEIAPLPHEPDHLARGERADEEVKALHPEQRKTQQEGEKACHGRPEEHGNRDGKLKLLGGQRRCVGADAHDDRVRQGPFAGQRQQAIAADQQHVDDQEDQDLLLREREQMRERDQNDREQTEAQYPSNRRIGLRLRHVLSLQTDPSA
jgi:hypothetical protein